VVLVDAFVLVRGKHHAVDPLVVRE
jgi:hypothetical protein